MCYTRCVTEATIVKSVRMPAELWAKVHERAKAKQITPNAWMVRMVKDAFKRLEEAKK